MGNHPLKPSNKWITKINERKRGFLLRNKHGIRCEIGEMINTLYSPRKPSSRMIEVTPICKGIIVKRWIWRGHHLMTRSLYLSCHLESDLHYLKGIRKYNLRCSSTCTSYDLTVEGNLEREGGIYEMSRWKEKGGMGTLTWPPCVNLSLMKSFIVNLIAFSGATPTIWGRRPR